MVVLPRKEIVDDKQGNHYNNDGKYSLIHFGFAILIEDMKSYLKSIICILLATAWFQALSQDQIIPELKRRVTDQVGLLSTGQTNELEQLLAEFEQQKGSQVAVLIIESTQPETIEQYSIQVVDRWKIGRENIDDGALLIIATDDRKLRIEVGYGLEGTIPDALAKRIINNIIVPHFRDGDYYLGIEEGIEAILSLINGEELPEVAASNSNRKTQSLGLFMVIILGIFGVVIAKAVLNGKLGNTKSNLIIIPLVFIVVWVLINLGTALFASFISLVFLNGRGGGGNRRGGGYYGGYSSYGGGGFSGGSFGGFSGGGGGFGGGGASGGW